MMKLGHEYEAAQLRPKHKQSLYKMRSFQGLCERTSNRDASITTGTVNDVMFPPESESMTVEAIAEKRKSRREDRRRRFKLARSEPKLFLKSSLTVAVEIAMMDDEMMAGGW